MRILASCHAFIHCQHGSNKGNLGKNERRMFKELRPEQAGFRFNKEQSIEWESPLYSTGMDFEKVYNSVDWTTIWKLMKHYLIPSKYISIIRNLFDDATCHRIPNGKLTHSSKVKTGVMHSFMNSFF